jgi:transposase
VLAAYRQEGAAGLAHGNRGRVSPQRLSVVVSAEILQLAQTEYFDYNDQHFCEELADRYDIEVSRSTVRRLRRGAGLGSPRKRRSPRYHRRRERYAQAGMLLQIDGSPHDWLEGRGPWLTLIAAIDDATNEIPFALFREHEDAAGYYLLVQQILQTRGRPLALYADRHTIFQSPKEETLDDQLAGKLPRTQFGRLLDELGIHLVAARSPQAKGRVERLFGTLQDRLVKALRRANATTLEEANQQLQEFLPQYNTRFMVEAAQPGSAYRDQPAYREFQHCFCFRHERTVANDNTVSFAGYKLQIPPGPHQRSYARARVQLCQHLDGHITIHYQDQRLASFDADPSQMVRVSQFAPLPGLEIPRRELALDPQKSSPSREPKTQPRPAANHPWRRALIGTERPTVAPPEQP